MQLSEEEAVKLVSLCEILQKNLRTLTDMHLELEAEVRQLQELVKTQG